MLRFQIRCSLLFVAFVSFFTVSSGQDNERRTASGYQTDVIRVDTTLITIPIKVMDRDGKFLPNLRREEVQVFEDGVKQEIAFFEGAEKPFVIALVLDVSDSTRFQIKNIQEAANDFIKQLRPNDRCILLTFDKKVRVLSEITSDRRILSEAIGQIETGGGTSLFNAVELVLRQSLNNIPGRKAVVLFTDGVDTTSLTGTYDSTLRRAEESDMLFYTIKYDTYEDVTRQARSGIFSQEQMGLTIGGERASTVYERANRYLVSLTGATGGRLYSANTTEHLASAFTQIVNELRQQYRLGYYPEDRDKLGRRRIVVKVDVPKASVKSRKYYVYKTSNQE